MCHDYMNIFILAEVRIPLWESDLARAGKGI